MSLRPKEAQEALGAKVRELREHAGLTLQGLSEQLRANGAAAGTSVQHLSQIERGASWPSATLLRAIGSVLGHTGELLYLLREAKVPALSAPADAGVVATG